MQTLDSQKAGVARNVGLGTLPLNGLRHQPGADTSGWYIWAGEESSAAADFFEPQHVAHLRTLAPEVDPYLDLPPGWRFLIAGDYEDVWFDDAMARIVG